MVVSSHLSSLFGCLVMPCLHLDVALVVSRKGRKEGRKEELVMADFFGAYGHGEDVCRTLIFFLAAPAEARVRVWHKYTVDNIKSIHKMYTLYGLSFFFIFDFRYWFT